MSGKILEDTPDDCFKEEEVPDSNKGREVGSLSAGLVPNRNSKVKPSLGHNILQDTPPKKNKCARPDNA